MGGTTNSQALRFPYVDEVIASTHIQNFATDCASKLDVQDANRLLVVHKPLAAVTRFAAQNIAVNTDTTIIWDGVGADPAGMVNLGTQPTRITVPAAYTGLWRVQTDIFTSGPSWTRTQVSILVTGVVRAAKTYKGLNFSFAMLTALVNVPNANDYIEMRVRHAGGGTDPISPTVAMSATLVAKT